MHGPKRSANFLLGSAKLVFTLNASLYPLHQLPATASSIGSRTLAPAASTESSAHFLVTHLSGAESVRGEKVDTKLALPRTSAHI